MVAEPRSEAVHVDKDGVDVGAADQGIMFGYASGEMVGRSVAPTAGGVHVGKDILTSARATKASCLAPEDEIELTIPLPHQMRMQGVGTSARMMLTSMRAAKTPCSGARVRGLNDAMPLTRLMATRAQEW